MRFIFPIFKSVVVAALLIQVTCEGIFAQSSDNQDHIISPNGQIMENNANLEKSLKTKGKNLREAIDKRFDELFNAGMLKGVPAHRNLLNDVVFQYIPLGSSFDEAEIILKAAGFIVGPREELFTFVRRGDYGVSATINSYKTALFQNTSIGVILRPKSSTDWSSVANIETSIVRSSL